MAKKLFVGRIAWATTDDSLRAHFEGAGEVVSAVVMMDKFTGKSRGFGFVEMATDEQADAAISMFNEKMLDGRVITVNEARPLEERPPRRDFAPRAPRPQRNEW